MRKVRGVDDGKGSVLGGAEEDVGVEEKVGGFEQEESGLDRPRFRAMNHRRVLGMVNDRRIRLGRSVSEVSEGRSERRMGMLGSRALGKRALYLGLFMRASR